MRFFDMGRRTRVQEERNKVVFGEWKLSKREKEE